MHDRGFRIVSEALKAFPSFQPILLLDTSPCHITDSVAAKAASLNIWLVPVPVGLTHLLQPLDVYAFAGYKDSLRNEYRRVRSEHGSVTPQRWLQLLFAVCTRYLNSRQWSVAFAQAGLGAPSANISTELQTFFPQGLPQQPATCLSSAELSRLLRSNRKVRFLHWVRAPADRRRSLTVS